MRVDDFDFELPESLIAKYPLPERSASRLLCVNRETGETEHRQFKDIVDFLRAGDLLVFNDTRVIPARLWGKKSTGGRLEVLVERLLSDSEAQAHIRASKAPKPGSRIMIEDAEFEITGRDGALFNIRLFSSDSLSVVLEKYGHMPLPPYIDRADESLDQERYQTVFSKVPGAVAAPTAGLHFDQQILSQLEEKGVEFSFVTLHVGAGTFQPVRVDSVLEHKMHKEYLEVDEKCCSQIKEAKARGSQVIAVGTTAVRSLESAATVRTEQGGQKAESGKPDGLQEFSEPGELAPYRGDTQIFIYPGYDFKVVDGMITNFHLPRSTLLMLVSAFAGRENILNAYQEAIADKYRFFSYGDAMFLHGKQC